MANHWNDDGDLVIEERTLFRQVGWLTHNSKTFLLPDEVPDVRTEGYSPVYEQIAVDHDGEGWDD